MQFGLVTGTVVSTQKVAELKGISLKLVIPCSSERVPSGEPIVAVDSIGARNGDLIMWVSKREASLAIPGVPLSNLYPIDAAITGIIDATG